RQILPAMLWCPHCQARQRAAPPSVSVRATILALGRYTRATPTYQPVEPLASLRAMPGLVTLRPGDANEVIEAYRSIIQLRHASAVLGLSRQPLPPLDRQKYTSASGVARGAYVLGAAAGGNPDVMLLASGSEVRLAVEAHEQLIAEGIRSRVVSMPSWDLCAQQTQEYQESVLPPQVTARRGGTGLDVRGIGAAQSTPEKFGFEPDQVAAAAKAQLGRP